MELPRNQLSCVATRGVVPPWLLGEATGEREGELSAGEPTPFDRSSRSCAPSAGHPFSGGSSDPQMAGYGVQTHIPPGACDADHDIKIHKFGGCVSMASAANTEKQGCPPQRNNMQPCKRAMFTDSERL
jgi:hypothetical protein